MPVSIREKRPIAKPQWSYFPLKIKTLDTLIPPWRMTCNLKSFGASEEEVRDFGVPRSYYCGFSYWASGVSAAIYILYCGWSHGRIRMVMIGTDSWCGLDFVSGGLTQLQLVRRMGWQKRWVGRRILQKSKNYLRSGT